MPVIVQKYGGTSVADAGRIQTVADRVVRYREGGYDILVVVSAMGDTTDEFLAMAHEISRIPEPRELDMLLTAGERISMSLLAIAINARGCKAASYTGSQAGIITDTQHGAAKIVEIRPKRIKESLDAGNVVIVAGFQGLSTNYDITTLGRGGSDTTAVAMAAALEAEVCEIFTDVDGVFTADPRVVPAARKIDRISYEDMLELAAAGAKVLHSRSVEYARRNDVPIHVRSSFNDEPGTWVVKEDEVGMEQVLISGVALDDGEAKITMDEVPDRPGVAAIIFKAVAAEGVNVDMIVQNVSHDGRTDMSFTVPRGRPRAPGSRGRTRGEGDRRDPLLGRRRYLEGLARRCRHEESPRRRCGHVRRSRGRGHQHRDDLHVADPRVVRRARRRRRARRSRDPRTFRPRRHARRRRGLIAGAVPRGRGRVPAAARLLAFRVTAFAVHRAVPGTM